MSTSALQVPSKTTKNFQLDEIEITNLFVLAELLNGFITHFLTLTYPVRLLKVW